MQERITVYLDGNPIEIFRGMQLKHVLLAKDYTLFKAATEGSIYLVDDKGFRVGLEGALSDNARFFIHRS